MRGRGGRRRSRRRKAGGAILGRQLLIAIPGLGLALILFAQAANNDLASLGTDTPPTTPVTIETAGDPDTGSTAPTPVSTDPGQAPVDQGVGTTADLTGRPPGNAPAATATLDQAPLATDQLDTATTRSEAATTRQPNGDAVTATTTETRDTGQPDTGQPDTGQPESARRDDAGADTDGGNPGGALGADESTGPGDGGSGITGLIRTALTAVAVAASVAGTIYLIMSMIQGILQSRRRRADDGTDIEEEEDQQTALITIDPTEASWTLEQLKARLEADPDPRSAIRHAYGAVESGFGAGGGLARRRTETPLQYLERTLGTMEESVQPLRMLTGLFLLARYSNRPITETMRRAAIDAVVDLQGSYRRAEGVAA